MLCNIVSIRTSHRPPKGATRDHRVTLALKYHYLDGLNAGGIKERFEQEGAGEYARSMILDYLNDSPKEQVIEQIDKEQAHVREQIADRQEQLWAQARDAEFNATPRRTDPARSAESTSGAAQ